MHLFLCQLVSTEVVVTILEKSAPWLWYNGKILIDQIQYLLFSANISMHMHTYMYGSFNAPNLAHKAVILLLLFFVLGFQNHHYLFILYKYLPRHHRKPKTV